MIAIIDYKMGNLRSVENALHRLGAEFEVTADADKIVRADRVLHGVAHTSGGYSVTSLRLLMMAFVATYLFIALYALVR